MYSEDTEETVAAVNVDNAFQALEAAIEFTQTHVERPLPFWKKMLYPGREKNTEPVPARFDDLTITVLLLASILLGRTVKADQLPHLNAELRGMLVRLLINRQQP